MASIDLYEDFNEEEDAQLGDFEEVEDNNQSGDENKNDQNENDENRQEVDPGIKSKKPKRKLVTLNAERLKGPRGIIAIDDFFQNIKLKGKGFEREDLNEVMKRLEHWSHRMFPKYHFDDALTKIERLGRKKEVAMHMTRYRLGQLTKDDENQVLSDTERDNLEDSLAHELPVDEFEDMLNQQIALSTTGNRINNTTSNNDTTVGNLNMSSVSTSTQIPAKPISQSSQSQLQEMDVFSQLKYPSPKPQLTDEQRARIEENRQKALAIRAARMKEAEEKRLKEAEEQKLKERTHHSINIEIDDDFC